MHPLSIAMAFPRCTVIAIAPVRWRVMAALVHVPALHRSPSSLTACISYSASLAMPPLVLTDMFSSSAPSRDATPAYLACFLLCLPFAAVRGPSAMGSEGFESDE